MATYTPQTAIDTVKAFVHGIPLDAVDSQVCDLIHSQLWFSWPWSWTKAALTAFTLTDGVQDYSNVPADYHRCLAARIVRTDITPNEWRELDIVAFLSPERTQKSGIENMRAISREQASNVFRLDKAVSVPTGVTLQIQGEYQKTPTRITDNNLTSTTVLGLPDHYFFVFQEGVLWKLYQLADDPRAGNVAITRDGTKQYTGQLGVFQDAFETMRRAEDVADANLYFFPDSNFGQTRPGSPGLFGW